MSFHYLLADLDLRPFRKLLSVLGMLRCAPHELPALLRRMPRRLESLCLTAENLPEPCDFDSGECVLSKTGGAFNKTGGICMSQGCAQTLQSAVWRWGVCTTFRHARHLKGSHRQCTFVAGRKPRRSTIVTSDLGMLQCRRTRPRLSGSTGALVHHLAHQVLSFSCSMPLLLVPLTLPSPCTPLPTALVRHLRGLKEVSLYGHRTHDFAQLRRAVNIVRIMVS